MEKTWAKSKFLFLLEEIALKKNKVFLFSIELLKTSKAVNYTLFIVLVIF